MNHGSAALGVTTIQDKPAANNVVAGTSYDWVNPCFAVAVDSLGFAELTHKIPSSGDWCSRDLLCCRHHSFRGTYETRNTVL